jgi:hypothetical protein
MSKKRGEKIEKYRNKTTLEALKQRVSLKYYIRTPAKTNKGGG